MIDRSDNDGVTWLTLNHRKANAFDLEFSLALVDAMGELHDGAGAVVFTGQGSIFSAGVDLKRIVAEGESYIRAFLPALDDAFRAVFTLPRPTVAAVNGHAIAGGAVLACACDHSVMARGDGRVGLPELAVGVPFPPSVVGILSSALPRPRLRSILLGGGLYAADDALTEGLMHELVDADALTASAQSRAQALARAPAASYAATKALINTPALAPADALGLDATIEAWCSEPVRSAIARYVEQTLGG